MINLKLKTIERNAAYLEKYVKARNTKIQKENLRNSNLYREHLSFLEKTNLFRNDEIKYFIQWVMEVSIYKTPIYIENKKIRFSFGVYMLKDWYPAQETAQGNPVEFNKLKDNLICILKSNDSEALTKDIEFYYLLDTTNYDLYLLKRKSIQVEDHKEYNYVKITKLNTSISVFLDLIVEEQRNEIKKMPKVVFKPRKSLLSLLDSNDHVKLLQYVVNFNWDDDIDPLIFIANNRNCDFNTAKFLYLQSIPWMLTEEEINDDELLSVILKNIKEKKYTYDQTNDSLYAKYSSALINEYRNCKNRISDIELSISESS